MMAAKKKSASRTLAPSKLDVMAFLLHMQSQSTAKRCLAWIFFALNAGFVTAFAEETEPAVPESMRMHIQVLAASCAACHGTDGNSVSGTPVLAGLDSNHFALQMQAFRTGQRSATVMQHHAKGLSDEEIQRLANHFSHLPRTTPQRPKSAP